MKFEKHTRVIRLSPANRKGVITSVRSGGEEVHVRFDDYKTPIFCWYHITEVTLDKKYYRNEKIDTLLV